MIKVTKFENNGQRVLLREEGQKIEFIDGVIKVYDEKGKKVVKTLKSEKTIKKYIEAIENYKARKGLDVTQEKFEEVEEVQKVEEVAQEKVEEVKEVEEVAQVEEVKEIAQVEEVKEIGKNEEEHKENFRKEDFYNIPLTNTTMVIDATCKAHKEEIDGVSCRFTRFTIFLTTDNKELNDRLIFCLVENMEKNMSEGFGYNFKFDRDTLTSYQRGSNICHEMTLTIPLMSGMSEIRKNICTSYYGSKKNIQTFYKQVKKWFMNQEAKAKKNKKRSA